MPDGLIRIIQCYIDNYISMQSGSLECLVSACTSIPNIGYGSGRPPSPFVEIWIGRGSGRHGEPMEAASGVLMNTNEPEWNDVVVFNPVDYRCSFLLRLRNWKPSLLPTDKSLYHMDSEVPLNDLFRAPSVTLPMKMVDGNGFVEEAYSQDLELTVAVKFTADINGSDNPIDL